MKLKSLTHGGLDSEICSKSKWRNPIHFWNDVFGNFSKQFKMRLCSVCVCVCVLHMHLKKNACMHSLQHPNICLGVLLQMWHLKTWQIMPLANRKSPRNIFSDYSRLQSLILNCFGKFPKMSFQKWILHFDFEHISESRPPWVNDFNFHW